MQKHAFHSSNTAAFTVTVFTNFSVLFVIFSVLTGFSFYMRRTVHIRLVKHKVRTSLTEALIVKTKLQEIFTISFFHRRFPSVHQINTRYPEFWKYFSHMEQVIMCIFVISLLWIMSLKVVLTDARTTLCALFLSVSSLTRVTSGSILQNRYHAWWWKIKKNIYFWNPKEP